MPLKDLDPRLLKQVENARKAIDKNPAYAVDILAAIVKRNPACLEVRKILRQAQQKAVPGKGKGLSGLLGKVSVKLSGESKLKKDPAAAMDEAEKQLRSNPANTAAHDLLGRAAERQGLLETAAFAYEEVRRLEPGNTANLKALMNVYIELGRNEEAIRIGDQAYKMDSGDEEISNMIKKASVQQSIDKGKWEEGEDFRSKLKDEGEAEKLEQAARARTGEAGLRSLVEEARKRVEEEPDNINHYRELSSHHRKLGEFDEALEWIEKARRIESGKADVTLERLSAQIRLEKARAAISAKEEALAKDPDNDALKKELEELQAAERKLRREQAKAMVQRYPNEFAFRFELGELYFEDGMTDEAIRELQLAQRSPKVRLQALILLGKAYMEKGFHDLAAGQFVTAKQEIPGVTDQKKDVLYQLGTCYEAQGDTDKAMAEFKALYGADISYRDVAAKIDAFYSKGKEG
jgi:tetratricopeptide (TPR) repeat protein